ncbi:RagB/SusD family nutrient uptake outer membrane protein [Pedobacter nyackensis]|uniref:SusD family protein n=1 Tax=Pedobacter nyackensis TaxID=475255 RepID=A0A1W2B0H6_9SPHI|nr:RagB/SusD family nutrient uptake outer membrane protein [Pedobacter nyackensis]SMC66436.1 SusD family protein [Pedobacter nyackensis]
MKHKIVITYLILVFGLLTGCKKFLDLPPKNQRTVTTATDVKSLLGAYLRGVVTIRIKPLYGQIVPACPTAATLMFAAYSDDLDVVAALRPGYLFSGNFYISTEAGYADLLLWNQQATSTMLWSHHYEIVGFLNSLIDQLGTIPSVSNTERDQLLGEMYANRAYSLFKLLQYYGIYNNADMGIPIYLHTGEGVLGIKPKRETHAGAYKIILEDLNKALEMVNRTRPATGFSALYNKRYINHLLAQVYWYKAESPAKEASDYAQVKTHSLAALEAVDALIPTTALGRINAYGGKDPNYPVIFQQSNSQGAYGAIYGSEFEYLGIGPINIPLNADFAALFTSTDIRVENYFNTNPSRAGGKVGTAGKILNWGWPADGTVDGTNKSGQVCMFKPEEAYMLLIEAQYRLGAEGDALITLNKFRAFRNAGILTGLSGTVLLQEIINERRREFFGDTDKRWLDLKRYANKTITRNITFFNKQYNITVPPNDYRYALPIPLVEIQENRNIVPNPGWGLIEY